jgi:WD repeat-containing protein 23
MLTLNVFSASAWNGYNMARGTVTVHSFNSADADDADVPLGRSVDSKLRADDELYLQAQY